MFLIAIGFSYGFVVIIVIVPKYRRFKLMISNETVEKVLMMNHGQFSGVSFPFPGMRSLNAAHSVRSFFSHLSQKSA
jgi:hypothetical protein